MSLLRTFLVLAVTTGAVVPASAQLMTDSWRWRSSTLQTTNALGLSAGRTVQPVYCGSVLFPCDPGLVQGANFSLTGKAGLGGGFSLYGRLGASTARNVPGLPLGSGPEGAESTVGVGVSWDFTPRASATLGWDSYDFRTATGRDPVRFTNIGLQWRY